jgi:glycosyltransferase involved in cell wall biosynthesis
VSTTLADRSASLRVLLLAPYPLGTVPGQRFRFEQYLQPLAARGVRVDVHALLDAPGTGAASGLATARSSAAWFLRAAAQRLHDVLTAASYDLVFVYREAYPLGPPVFERVLAARRTPFMVDFDDAIWLPNSSSGKRLVEVLKNPRKTRMAVRRATLVTTGNEYLADWARRLNPQVRVIPTTIDTDVYRPPAKPTSDRICIGWTGSVTTAPYLESLCPLLADLQRRHRVRLRVIGARPGFRIPGAEVEAMPWSSATEVADISAIDIGLMPLPETEWARGKCGLKALQYMALGIPTVMSPVGVNRKIAAGGAAVLARELREWEQVLEHLIADGDERERLGGRGRRRVEDEYSVRANLSQYVDALNHAADRAREPRTRGQTP